MLGYEQSKSEETRGNKCKASRASISKNILKGIEAEQKEKEFNKRRAEREAKVGKPGQLVAQLIMEGSQDRLNAVPYNPNKYDNAQHQAAYEEGFYEHGTRELFGKLSQLSNEQLESIGRNDYISNINPKTLPEDIKNNVSYTQGYIMATIMSDVKPKGRK